MSETEYAFTITHHRTRAGRKNFGEYIAEITGPNGFTLTSPRFYTDTQAREWADKFVAAKAAGLVKPALPTQEPKAAPASATTRRAYPTVDRQAARVANLMGLPAPKATGCCHYCGLPLTNGNCEECV